MPLRDDLLNPIPGANPAGSDLRSDEVYQKIKLAREEDEDLPTGGWDRPRKVADWALVVKLASEAIATRSKDVSLAVSLAEAQLRREGYAGFAAACDAIRGIAEQYWEGCFPQIEDDDLELRAAPIERLGTKSDFVIKSVALCKAGHDFWKYKQSRATPTEQEAEGDDAKRAVRATAMDEGKLPPEVFDKAFAETPKAWYRQLTADVSKAVVAVEMLDTSTRDRFGADRPNLLPLRTSLDDVRQVVEQLLARKLQVDPDPVGTAGETDTGLTGSPASRPSLDDGSDRGRGVGATSLAVEPVDAADAVARVVGASRFLRQLDPTSPTSYLLLRALRWGELRAQGPDPDPRLLDAPSAQARTRLRTLMLNADWTQLLEVAETVMGTPAGRGWLDLQRYVLSALDAMGEEYARAARATRRELRTLLGEIPTLPEMTLMDDLPTSSPATLAWLRSEALLGEAGNLEVAAESAPSAPGGAVSGSADRLLERALAEVQAGQTARAIEMVKRELGREHTERGRFLRQVQLTRVLMEAGLDNVAIPTLQRLVGLIDTHKLESWEEGKLVAEPLSLLYRALERTDGDSEQRQALYPRICELDPMAAITFGSVTTAPTLVESDGEGA